jgi:biotin transport system substrate-specific component
MLAFATFVIGQLIIFVPGLIVLKISVDESWGWTIHNGFTIFIVGGLVKAAIGGLALPGAWQLVRRFERR